MLKREKPSPKECKDLDPQVTVGGKTYITTNPTSAPTYSYYWEDDKEREQMHFTVDAGKGKNIFSRFHITFVFGGINAKLNYTNGEPDGEDAHLPDQYGKAWQEIVKNRAEAYDPLALEFWNVLK